MTQYLHAESWDFKEQLVASVGRIKYGGRDVLVRYFYGKDIDPPITVEHASGCTSSLDKLPPAVFVVGFIQGEYMKRAGPTSLPVTDVEPVVDPIHREELTDLIRKTGEKRPINFW